MVAFTYDDPRVPLGNLSDFLNRAGSASIESEYVFSKFSSQAILDLLVANPSWAEKCFSEQTVNAIHVDNSTTCFTFSGGQTKPTSTANYRKDRIAVYTYRNLPSIFLRLSDEVKLAKPTDSAKKMFRIKNRLCIPISDGKNVLARMDVTQIFSTEELAAVQPNRTAMFSATSMLSGINLYRAFIDTAGSKKLELEIELMRPVGFFHTAETCSLDYLLSLVGGTIQAAVARVGYLNSIADMFGIKGSTIKQIASKAITLTKHNYMKIYPPTNYFLTHKADGLRALLVILRRDDFSANYVITDDWIKISGDPSGMTIDSVFDCEALSSDLPDGKSETRVLVFDAMMIAGESVMDKPFTERYARMVSQTLPKFAEFKPYIQIDEGLNFRIADVKVDYETDGYILTSPDSVYQKTKSYKIKQENTIDFMAVQFERKWYLYSGISADAYAVLGMDRPKEDYTIFNAFRGNYFPMRFTPADCPHAYVWEPPANVSKELASAATTIASSIKPVVVVELLPVFSDLPAGKSKPNSSDEKLAGKSDASSFAGWNFIKIRQDRINEPNYFGNDFIKVAEVNWFAAQDPITLESMRMPPVTYFAEEKSVIYRAQTTATSVAKSFLIRSMKKVSPNGFVLDLASGNGQDWKRYPDAGYTSALFIDQDRIALAELLTRRYKHATNRAYEASRFKVNIGVENLNDPCDDILARLEPYFKPSRPGTIVCNFAIHYFTYTIAAMNNFVGLVKKSIAKNGYFLYTTFDGQRVHDLIKDTGEWSDHQDGLLKYRLKKMYASSEFVGFDQKIAVKLPFSTTLYEESLVDVGQLNKILGSVGFRITTEGHFDDLIPQVKKDAPGIASALNDSDRHYMSLYYWCILKHQ